MRIVKKVGVLSLVVVGLALLRLPALADATACRGDTQKFCKGVKQGEGRVLKCLGEHQAQLSEGCTKHLQEAAAQDQLQHNAAAQQMAQACKGDIAKLCKDVKRGEGRIMDCLVKHRSTLSAECGAALGGKGSGKK